MLFDSERYLVVVEERSTYNLLITAYQVNRDHEYKKLIKRYEKSRSKRRLS